jgi:hypothetical protein
MMLPDGAPSGAYASERMILPGRVSVVYEEGIAERSGWP